MTTTMNKATVEEAARWAARMEAADCTAAERSGLQRWLERDATHAEAYAEVQRVRRSVDALAADPRIQAMTAQMLAMGDADPDARHSGRHVPRARRDRRRLRPSAWAAGMAAGALMAVSVGAFVVSRPDASTAYAAVDERRSVMLDDGSEVLLDVNSEIIVSMARAERRIELLGGRALFNVAHDRLRPFSVAVDDTVVTALGTRFQVQKYDRRTLVTLTEGSVSVANPATARNERLIPGEQLSLANGDGVLLKRTVDTDSATSWSRGWHKFRETPLAEALSEVNRYAKRKVRLGDPSLAQLAVSGSFIAGDSEQIVKAFAAVLPLRVVSDGGGEIVLFGAHASSGG